MSYQVLARKWRPRRFEEVVGQEHVLRALGNALEQNRLHHAYLFTGTRGTGKTTLARILAKCLNCEQGITARPCGECAACTAIDQGRFVDLIEVDAASRAKVDETRDLMDNVQYAPTAGRFKVYLIDEVHMFSGHSFNALLKTLEEPPPHVKFLLATTEPKRIPVTILSRCIQFNLKHLEAAQIEAQLQKILEAEGIDFEMPACQLIARAAEGSLRDALSLLDQAIAYGNNEVREAQVREMLGTLDTGVIPELLELLAAGDGAAILQRIDGLAEHQQDYAAALAELLGYLHRIAILQATGTDPGPEAGQIESLNNLATALSPEDVQLYYQIALHGRRDLAWTPDPRSGFEMTLIRMLAFQPDTAGGTLPAAAGQVPRSQSRMPAVSAASSAPPDSRIAAGNGRERGGAASSGPGPAGQNAVCNEKLSPEDWAAAIEAMNLTGLARQLASHCVLKEHTSHKLHLLLAPAHAALLASSQQERLQQDLRARYGEQLKLVITVEQTEQESPADEKLRQVDERQRQAVQSLEQDPMVQAMLETFDAVIEPDSIRPESAGRAKN